MVDAARAAAGHAASGWPDTARRRLMKLAFEKYFLWKARNGYVNLP